MVANVRAGAFKRLSRGDKTFLVFNYGALSAVLLIVLYPLIYIVSSSLSSVRFRPAG